jgi:methylamine dehydrogenase accessory protein MauD
MSIIWILSNVVLWVVVLFLGFLLLGTLRALEFLRWQMEQLAATMPRRLGRDGLKPGKKAPDFTLPSANGTDISLRDFAGRKVFLVFTQSGCSPCKAIVPALNLLSPACQVLVINNGDAVATRKWSHEVGARFPVLAQTQLSTSKKYEVYATPFAFLIDEKGVIVSKGIINNRQHIRYVLWSERAGDRRGHAVMDTSAEQDRDSNQSVPHLLSTEVSHV